MTDRGIGGILWSMDIAVRNLVSRMMVFFRLAIVVSLVGYTVPNATAAMHGSAFAEIEVSAPVDHHGDGDADSHGTADKQADAGHHGGGGHHDRDGSMSGKQVQKDCCQDFCFSVALPSPYQAFEPVTVATPLRVFDDSRVHGTRPSLHRPPNIRV
ncbi:hypothetical protein M0654_12580 [Rhizobium sp. NTR19]|uniref:DUF2946 domain-containing protein n=1 Tax=Neorhizobium turbinariae TaxID=2937795 RepID=A0ABT0ISI9_9HYPH|nr:hypothetical protein [Neorhizobium turbinariae]MCK8780821.1 hypothetical protein [Neorhizobium turbinariae]